MTLSDLQRAVTELGAEFTIAWRGRQWSVSLVDVRNYDNDGRDYPYVFECGQDLEATVLIALDKYRRAKP